jgi:resuscitation-promoting factor RpfB
LLRSVKYGLYGAVLAGLVGGTVAWTNVDKTVQLVVDGQRTSVHTTASSVRDVLSAAGYHPGAHDILAPSADAAVHDGSTVVFKRGRLLYLTVDGSAREVWTTAPTVAEALSQLGYSTQDFTSVSRSRRLPLGPTDIAVRTPKLITVVHDGRTEQVSTTDATVGELLDQLSVPVGADDLVAPSTAAALTENARVVVKRVVKRTVTRNQALPFTTRSTKDASRTAGDTTVVVAGKDGLARIIYAVVYVDGTLAGRTRVSTVVVRPPTTKVVKVGTKAPPRAPHVASVSPGSAQAIAQKLVKARGWSNTQFDCLVTLWNHESGWRVHAGNSSSGAYGIPQALPGSKMGPGWQDDATVQITWGLGYIANRYGTPCGAWSVWQGQGWY